MKSNCYPALAGIAACALLTACGGGGSSSAPPTSGTPAPSPSPTPSPTPTPTPSASYSTFAALTGDRAFASSCGELVVSGSNYFAIGSTAFGNGIPISYAASSQTYTVAAPPLTIAYGPADLDPAAPTDTIGYRKVDSANFANRFSITRPTLASGSLDYVRHARTLFRETNGTIHDAFCVIGVPTLLTDPLPSSSINFPAYSLRGTASATISGSRKQYDLAESTMTFTANPTSRAVNLSITLVGREISSTGLSDTRINFGQFDGQSSVDGAAQSFGMTLQSPTRISSGSQAAGWFFGPSGAELGLTFTIRVNDSASQIEAVGSVVADR